jgi:regulator of sirC expression with transglutaminase-like and TPR domain
MNAAPAELADREAAHAFLRQVGAMAADPLPLAQAALVLAALDRPCVDLQRYHRHLDALGRDTAAIAGAAVAIEDGMAALIDVIFQRFGYAGDVLTYEDPQNANLMRVIDRRRGLPVALGILCIHAARAQGWAMVGLNFPGHFLVRLEHDGQRAVLDPFHGCVRRPDELRDLLRKIAGEGATLTPHHYAPVSDRAVLLRLQNNLKLRHLENRQPERALTIVEGMMLFAPAHAGLWHEAGLLNAQLGNLRAAVANLEHFLALAGEGGDRHQAAVLLQRLRAHLN